MRPNLNPNPSPNLNPNSNPNPNPSPTFGLTTGEARARRALGVSAEAEWAEVKTP